MTYHFLPANFLPRRALAFSGVAAFHVLVAYLLLTALVQPAPRTPDTPITGFVILEPLHPPLVSLTDVVPDLRKGPVVVPPIDPVAAPQRQSPLAPRVEKEAPGSSAAALPAALPIRLIGTNQFPSTYDYYPAELRRAGVEGASNIRACVDPQGKLVGTPAVEESSGYAHLDAEAVDLTRHARFARSMQGDTPVGNCFRFRIAFKIQR
jgi:TonB family protein